jgi:membrane protein
MTKNQASTPQTMAQSKQFWGLIRDSVYGWMNDHAPRKGAALAFYTVFSLTPVLIISISVAGFFFGEEAARGEISRQVRDLVGPAAAEAVEDMIRNSSKPKEGLVATIFGMITFLIGATTALTELKNDLDEIWETPPERHTGWWQFIHTRLLSLGLVLAVGFLLLVSLVFSAALAALRRVWGIDSMTLYLETINVFITFILVTLLFAMIYKVLPNYRIAWRDVWMGAMVTSLLFSVGKFLIGFYLGNSAIASSYGAAGSLTLVLVWVYYSAQIFLLGAEFTKFYAYRYGSRQEKPEAASMLETAKPPSNYNSASRPS